MTVSWTHKTLLADLRGFLEFTGDYVCNEVNAGSRWLFPDTPIPDILRIRKSYTRPDFVVYEVKASRSDFMSDITKGKWKNYLPFCSRIYFATPAKGVATAGDIPPGVGWMTRKDDVDGGWSVRKAPVCRQFEPDFQYVMALLMAEAEDRQYAERQVEVARYQARMHNVQFGKKVAKILNNRHRALRRIQFLRRRYFEAARELEVQLGIRIFKNWGDDLASRLREVRSGIPERELQTVDAYVSRLREAVDKLKSRGLTPGHKDI